MESSIEFEKEIVFCILGDAMSHNFLRSWTEIVGYCLMNKIKPVLSSRNQNNFVDKALVLMATSETCTPFDNKVDYDRIIYLNTNTLCSIDVLKKMINSDLEIVTALKVNNSNLEKSNYVKSFDLDGKSKTPFEFESMESANEILKRNKEQQITGSETINHTLVKVEYFEFGLTSIKKGVFEKLQMPWFNYEGKTRDITGEVYFCQKCKKAGIDMYVDVSCFINTEKKILY